MVTDKSHDPMTLDRLRNELPITEKLLYFDTARNGPTSEPVLQTVADEMAIESHGELAYAVTGEGTSQKQLAREDAARADLASLLNVDVDALGMLPNTTQALHRVMNSIDWKYGDELCVSSVEHLSTFHAAKVLGQRHGVILKTIPATYGDDDFLERLRSTLSDRTKLLVVSQVSSPDGRRLPVCEATDLAHERGIPVAVDGAQAVGVYPVDVSALGCDFYVAGGHKWLLGPRGTGFVWVSSEQTSKFRPDLFPEVSLWQNPDVAAPPFTVRKRVEGHTYNHALIIGLGHAVRIALEIGLETIETKVTRLSTLLRNEISEWKDTRILTPTAPKLSAGITTLAFDGLDDDGVREVIARLSAEDNVIVKFQWLSVPSQIGNSGIRISMAAFNSEQDVKTLLERLRAKLTDVGGN